jgi:hypothetical protein
VRTSNPTYLKLCLFFNIKTFLYARALQ